MSHIEQSAAYPLLITRMVKVYFIATSEESDFETGWFEGVVMDKNDESENSPGDQNIYMSIDFEDGDSQSYSVPAIMQLLVPWCDLELQSLENTSTRALDAQLK